MGGTILFLLLLIQIPCALVGIGGIVGVLLSAHFREKEKLGRV